MKMCNTNKGEEAFLNTSSSSSRLTQVIGLGFGKNITGGQGGGVVNVTNPDVGGYP